MKRRTLDIIFATGGVVIALAIFILGLVLADQYNWGKEYVKEELAAQKITFAAADKLTDDEKNWKPGSVCLVENAGKVMETGKQAECYAKYYIGMHLDKSAKTAAVDGKSMGWEGQTYATMGTVQADLKAKIATAQGDEKATLEKQLAAANGLRSTLQTGETLRGLLLTSYGFSIFGDKANTVAQICYGVGVLLLIISAAGFVHAWVAKDDAVFEARGVGAAPGKAAPVA